MWQHEEDEEDEEDVVVGVPSTSSDNISINLNTNLNTGRDAESNLLIDSSREHLQPQVMDIINGEIRLIDDFCKRITRECLNTVLSDKTTSRWYTFELFLFRFKCKHKFTLATDGGGVLEIFIYCFPKDIKLLSLVSNVKSLAVQLNLDKDDLETITLPSHTSNLVATTHTDDHLNNRMTVEHDGVTRRVIQHKTEATSGRNGVYASLTYFPGAPWILSGKSDASLSELEKLINDDLIMHCTHIIGMMYYDEAYKPAESNFDAAAMQQNRAERLVSNLLDNWTKNT